MTLPGRTPAQLRSMFGANLRTLSSNYSSVSALSRDLGINRTQYNRYLSGESFPRPDVLARICDFFSVDARVLLEPVEQIPSHQGPIASPFLSGFAGRAAQHVPEDDLRAPVLAALGAQMGADIALSDNILVLPRPQCGALTGIANVGLPQSTDQITNPLLIGNDAHARVFGFVKDDALSFDITGPDYPAYIYVDFFDAGGDVIHLAPNDQVPLREIAADAPYRIGTRSPAEAGLHLRIGPPYGQEIAVAFAASEPLYEGLRPIVEPAAPYLEWLKARVAEAREKNPDFKGEWVYFFVATSES